MAEGYPHQFGSTPNTGCPDANFTLKSILQARRECDLSSWVAFLDLVKAFDTINHSLMLDVLLRFGVPSSLVRVVEKLYTNFSMELNIGDYKAVVAYVTGVKQGDALAPTLFIFVIQASPLRRCWDARTATGRRHLDALQAPTKWPQRFPVRRSHGFETVLVWC